MLLREAGGGATAGGGAPHPSGGGTHDSCWAAKAAPLGGLCRGPYVMVGGRQTQPCVLWSGRPPRRRTRAPRCRRNRLWHDAVMAAAAAPAVVFRACLTAGAAEARIKKRLCGSAWGLSRHPKPACPSQAGTAAAVAAQARPPVWGEGGWEKPEGNPGVSACVAGRWMRGTGTDTQSGG